MPVATPAIELEVEPQVRVRRSALAFAVSITLAAVPIIVIDNLPATAAPAKGVEVTSVSELSSTVKATVSERTPTTEAATTSSETTETTAPATTAAPSTTTTTAAPVPAPAPTTTAAPAPTTTAPPPPPAYGDPNDPATWDRLARCESGGNWAANTGNGYYGGLQFSLASWQDVGGSGYPHEHSREEQIHRGKILQSRYGWSQWPTCSEELGYR